MNKRTRNILIIGATVGVLGLTAYFLYPYLKKTFGSKKLATTQTPKFKGEIDIDKIRELQNN
jgi:hypothetical protein